MGMDVVPRLKGGRNAIFHHPASSRWAPPQDVRLENIVPRSSPLDAQESHVRRARGPVDDHHKQLRSTLKIMGLTPYASDFTEASIFTAIIVALACALTYRYCVSRIPRSSGV